MKQFSFFTPVRLIKSGNAQPGEPIKVTGRISTDDKDADGETLLTEGLDFSYFTKGFGKIKFEHDTELSKEPDNIIGFPTDIKKGKRHVDFGGELIEFRGIPDDQLTTQQRASKGAYGLIEAIEKYNQNNPTIKQTLGWSIEGEYIDRDKTTGVVKKARITSVVLTTKPKNPSTFAQFAKSLEVGYETETTEKTGFGATRRESVDHQKFINKEKAAMSEQEFYQSCLEKGMSEEEAKKATAEWKAKGGEAEKSNKTNVKKSEDNDMDDESKERIEELEEVEKSLNSIIGHSIKVDIGSTRKTMQKSISTKEGEEPDLLEIFENQNTAHVTSLEQVDLLNVKMDVLAKSLAVIAGALSTTLRGEQELKKSTKLTNAAVAKILKSAGNNGSLSTTLIDGVEVDDTSRNNAEPSFAEQKRAINALYDENKISKSVVVRFESARGFMDPETAQMVKSKVTEFRK